MLSSLMPASIMFSITVVFVTLFFVPATIYQRPNKLMNFYWVGFWLFLGLIASFAGAKSTLMLLGYNSNSFAESILFSLTSCFVIFVIFGWFRLSFSAIFHTFKRMKRKTP